VVNIGAAKATAFENAKTNASKRETGEAEMRMVNVFLYLSGFRRAKIAPQTGVGKQICELLTFSNRALPLARPKKAFHKQPQSDNF